MKGKKKKTLLLALLLLLGVALGVGYRYLSMNHPTQTAGHTAMDLGLSVRWADVNVGAESPLDLGTLADYENAQQLSWEGGWRMPTEAEWKELFEKCTLKSRDHGYSFTGPNGKEIFLPKINDSTFIYWSGSVSKALIPDGDTPRRTRMISCPVITGKIYLPSCPVSRANGAVAIRLVCE